MEHGERQQRRRFVVLTALFAGSIGFLVLYLFWLQIVKGFEFRQRARDVSQREMPIPAQRGEIFDRNADDPLVFNVDSFAVDVSPGEVSPSEIARPLHPAGQSPGNPGRRTSRKEFRQRATAPTSRWS